MSHPDASSDEDAVNLAGQRPGAEEQVVDERPFSCWRCEKYVRPVSGRCPYCRARLIAGFEERIVLPVESSGNPLVRVLCLLAALMLVSLVVAWSLHDRLRRLSLDTDWRELAFRWTAIGSLIGSGVMALGLVWVGRFRPFGALDQRWRLVVWLWSAPLLALLLAINFGYITFMVRYLQVPRLLWWSPTPLVILVLCLQPAIMEELFFRYLALNSLRQHMGLHGSVWISAIMFGFAHIGNPLAIPYLILLGGFLGYARLLSGTLLLPMLLHFVHNLAVLYLDTLL